MSLGGPEIMCMGGPEIVSLGHPEIMWLHSAGNPGGPELCVCVVWEVVYLGGPEVMCLCSLGMMCPGGPEATCLGIKCAQVIFLGSLYTHVGSICLDSIQYAQPGQIHYVFVSGQVANMTCLCLAGLNT